MDALAEERFRAKPERLGDHEVWTGAVDASGTGLVRIDGTRRTVQRAAREFAHGPLPPTAECGRAPATRGACGSSTFAWWVRGQGSRRPPAPAG